MKITSICLAAMLTSGCMALMLMCSSTPVKGDGEERQETNSELPHTTYLPVMPEKVDFCGEEFPLERDDVRESMDRELLTNTFWHTNMILTIKRANRIFPIIEPILEANGIPNDFKYLAVAESSLVPTVKSPAGAVGLWQILETTGKELSLEINNEVDERYNIEKSTVAACKYLKRAYESLGSWILVAAAYNGGQARVIKNISSQMQSSYFNVLWAEETSRYVFRIAAFKIIMAAPEKYGFNIDKEDLYKPYEYHTMTVDSTINDIAMFAVNNNTTYKAIKNLNPWLRQNKLTNQRRKSYKILIPHENH